MKISDIIRYDHDGDVVRITELTKDILVNEYIPFFLGKTSDARIIIVSEAIGIEISDIELTFYMNEKHVMCLLDGKEINPWTTYLFCLGFFSKENGFNLDQE